MTAREITGISFGGGDVELDVDEDVVVSVVELDVVCCTVVVVSVVVVSVVVVDVTLVDVWLVVVCGAVVVGCSLVVVVVVVVVVDIVKAPRTDTEVDSDVATWVVVGGVVSSRTASSPPEAEVRLVGADPVEVDCAAKEVLAGRVVDVGSATSLRPATSVSTSEPVLVNA